MRSTRSGRYIQQPSGYASFFPDALPPEPPIEFSESMQVLLSQADRSLGRLDGSIQTLPNPDWFVYMYVRKEAVLSSQIEGTQSSLQDVLAAEAEALSPTSPKDVDEVINYVAAMKHGLARLDKLPVCTRLIKEVHAKLLQGVRGSNLTPGDVRTSQNWIGAMGCTLREANFVPPPPEEVSRCLSELEKFLNSDTKIPLLVKIGLAHAQFETIHPFLDGNGRVGRLLITLLLCEKQVLTKPVLYLSYYFKRYRQDYYDHLQAVRDNGRWEEWLEFFLNGVLSVSDQAAKTASAIMQLRENHREVLIEHLGRGVGNAQRVLEYLYEHPIVTAKDVQTVTGTSYTAANNLVGKLNDAGILRKTTEQSRNRRFIYEEYIRLFDALDPP